MVADNKPIISFKWSVRLSDLTLEDIAKKAGVSRSTVSRVINERPNVRADVRRRVLDVIRTTGYHPNVAARTLASQRSFTLGLVLSRTVSAFFADPYFPRLVQGIAQACNQHNYTLALFLLDTVEDEEKILPRISRRSLLDGILIQSGTDGDVLIERLAQTGIPLVVAGRPMNNLPVSYIDIDNVNAAYSATNHLIRLGYKRIATISGPAASPVGVDRKEGYLKALSGYNRPAEKGLMVESDFTEMGGYYAMQQLLPVRPDAIFAAADIIAIGAMRAIREAGLRIPEDIAVVGFDDLPMSVLPKPQLTTVRQPVFQFGYNAVEILIDLIENDIKPHRRVIMDTELVVRETCGAFKVLKRE
jgi:LacI family transcriptional regulator